MKSSSLHDYWTWGSKTELIRVHQKPRTVRFTPIGIADCPVDIRKLSARRVTRFGDNRVESDYWVGTRAFQKQDRPWTGSTSFFLIWYLQLSFDGVLEMRTCVKLSWVAAGLSLLVSSTVLDRGPFSASQRWVGSGVTWLGIGEGKQQSRALLRVRETPKLQGEIHNIYTHYLHIYIYTHAHLYIYIHNLSIGTITISGGIGGTTRRWAIYMYA